MTKEKDRLPAQQNPWYVLMTVAGENTGRGVDGNLIAINRRYWNGWISARLTSESKARLIEERQAIPPSLTPVSDDLLPLSDEQHRAIKIALKSRANTHESELAAALNSSKIDFSGIEFGLRHSFFGFIFPSTTNFDNTLFLEGGGFEYTTFCGSVSFRSAVFAKGVSFKNARFWENANFNGVRFEGTADFPSAEFSSAASFANTSITGQAGFDWSIFFDSAGFSGMKVTGNADFVRTTFFSEVNFSIVEIKGNVNFGETEFRSSPPALYNAVLDEDASWFDSKWPSAPRYREQANDHLRRYERLKLLMDDLKKLHDEQFFHRKELECREVIDGFPANLPSRAYGFLSGYGWSIERPARGLATTVVGGWLLLAAALCSRHEVSKLGCMGETLLLSLSNTFSFLGIWRQVPEHMAQRVSENGFALTVAVLQMISGPVLLFLLLLAFRNRYRLR